MIMIFRVLRFFWQKCLTSLVLAAPIFFPGSGYSEEITSEQSLYDLVKQQQKMLKQQQQDIEELRKLVLEQQDVLKQRLDKTEHKVKKMAKSTSKVRLGRNGLRIQSKDGDFSFRAGGRIHADFAHYNDDVTPMGSGARLRRARLYFKGRLLHDWRYKAEIEFAENGRVGPRGVWLGYDGWKPVALKLGNFQEPFSLEEMTGSNTITFMERSLVNAFAPSYHVGFGANGYGNNWSLAGGLFGQDISNKKDSIDDGWGVAGRATFAPILYDNKLLHVGFSSEYRQTNSANIVRFRTRPESGVTNSRLVDTRTIQDVDNTWLFGGEMAAVYGPFSLQGEYIHNRVVRNQAANLDFYGAYVQGSWFLTGESRPYNVKKGTFKLIDPLHNYGAWQFGLRYSWLDLTDRNITGGKENNLTIGLNWYVNYNVRFMMNYIFVDAHPNRNGIDENPNILQMRGQLVF